MQFRASINSTVSPCYEQHSTVFSSTQESALKCRNSPTNSISPNISSIASIISDKASCALLTPRLKACITMLRMSLRIMVGAIRICVGRGMRWKLLRNRRGRLIFRAFRWIIILINSSTVMRDFLVWDEWGRVGSCNKMEWDVKIAKPLFFPFSSLSSLPKADLNESASTSKHAIDFQHHTMDTA